LSTMLTPVIKDPHSAIAAGQKLRGVAYAR
jgi:hypothetical protein